MQEILGYIAAVLIGMSLGLIGSGGSILTVPVLVYLMDFDPLIATTSSLLIVGATSLVGGIKAYSKKQVDFRTVTEFGIPSIFSIFVTRHFLLPAIPDHLFTIGGTEITKGTFLMIVFAILMIIASFFISRSREDGETNNIPGRKNRQPLLLVLLGLFVGLVTGLLGAGGGFIIIPSLVLFLKLRMKTAVGTSLMIIAINSLFGFVFSLKEFDFNWKILVTFTVLAIAGIFIGGKLSDKIPGIALKKGFGWFVLVMGIYIIIKEIFLK